MTLKSAERELRLMKVKDQLKEELTSPLWEKAISKVQKGYLKQGGFKGYAKAFLVSSDKKTEALFQKMMKKELKQKLGKDFK